ncbi:MAG TPA: DUF4177 domain-containing protein [Kofleriaceae bacterium]
MAQKFEYDIFTVAWGHGASTDGIRNELNRRGAEGWELVATTRDESPADDHDEEVVMFVFKRVKA